TFLRVFPGFCLSLRSSRQNSSQGAALFAMGCKYVLLHTSESVFGVCLSNFRVFSSSSTPGTVGTSLSRVANLRRFIGVQVPGIHLKSRSSRQAPQAPRALAAAPPSPLATWRLGWLVEHKSGNSGRHRTHDHGIE